MFKWKLAYAENRDCKNLRITTACDIESAGFVTMDATVPGSFEIDFMRENILPDIYYSTNTLEVQKYETCHFWYYTEFEVSGENEYIHFEGIDTVADIYVNGVLSATTDNMFLPCDVYDNINLGKNELVVHIKPVLIEGRKYELPATCNGGMYGYPGAYIRKAPYMFGWDIMPRTVSAGIYKPVEIRERKSDCIKDLFLHTTNINLENNTADLSININIQVSEDDIGDYTIRTTGKCRDHEFVNNSRLWHTSGFVNFRVGNAYLWWPRNIGEPNIYDVTVELLYKGEIKDTKRLDFGFRTVKLEREELDKDGNGGKFCFIVNGKKVFVMGTNWVPLDALPARFAPRLEEAFNLVLDIGCNMIRCWGGNIYESDEFFKLCDRNGVMVWQDFAMACAVYPRDKVFLDKLEKEAIYVIKKYRNHPSLVIWAGDNECDLLCRDKGNFKRDPNEATATRKLIPNVLFDHDFTRPYLPSSPFISPEAHKNNLPLVEDHTWGPRDYFKGDYYKNTKCIFASEVGYHGFPSTRTLAKFLEEPDKLFLENGWVTPEYIVHSANPQSVHNAPWAYRIPLAHNQVKTLFGKASDKLSDFVRQSQISQAEAMKYFIERVRIRRWQKTGIIWWNIIDGWPQVSDAVVDYYFDKKLAYYYIKRSQTPVCLMFDEPEEGRIHLYVDNDTVENANIEYEVINVTDNVTCLSGKCTAVAQSSAKLDSIKIADGEKKFYLIKWRIGDREYTNHYFTNAIDIDYDAYIKDMTKCGYDNFSDK